MKGKRRWLLAGLLLTVLCDHRLWFSPQCGKNRNDAGTGRGRPLTQKKPQRPKKQSRKRKQKSRN